MEKRPFAEPGSTCPFFQKDVSEVCHTCALYIRLEFVEGNPQNGKTVDKFGCALQWLPLMQIDVARNTAAMGKAVESLRNVVDQDRKDRIIEQVMPQAHRSISQ